VFDTAVAIDTYTIGFAYNKDAFKSRKAPQTWADFWNTKDFPGRRALFDNPRYTLEFALMADGVPKDKLYPLDVERAFKKLDELKPNISFFFNQWEQSGQALADGSAQVAVFALARGYPMLRQGAPIQVVWNGGATAYDYLVIPKHAKNRDAAMTFITWYANNAKAEADMARDFPQGPVNPKGLEFLSPDEREQMSVAHLDDTFVVGWEWWADNLAKIEERWNEWKLK
jgi:putative spermidine/putrescine transport system substrate-binding protein